MSCAAEGHIVTGKCEWCGASAAEVVSYWKEVADMYRQRAEELEVNLSRWERTWGAMGNLVRESSEP